MTCYRRLLPEFPRQVRREFGLFEQQRRAARARGDSELRTCALAGSRLAAAQLYGAGPFDPITFGCDAPVILVLAAAALDAATLVRSR